MRKINALAALTLCISLAFSGCASRVDETTAATSATTETTTAETMESETSKEYPKDCIVDPSVFSGLDKTISLEFKDKTVIQTGEVKERKYSLTVDLSSWEGNTTPEQIGELSRLFWQVYPQMYERFGKLSEAPVDVVLLIENHGYSVAEAWENKVHIHDKWLYNNTEDYDCFTHELAHVIQTDWDSEKLEFDGYIERFADYCRFIYCLDNGVYNDHEWTLQTVEDESTRETSVRFLVWLDYKISGAGRDFMEDYFRICTKGEYASSKWKKAWTALFKSTEFEGRSIDDVWKEYAKSEFASVSSYSDSEITSELLSKYDVRNKAKSLKG
ncbi:MAG: hypothetical protein IKW88_09905 [Clostridiales bacterium]|nr:hypothetical protein [Clostridiales bacterium]